MPDGIATFPGINQIVDATYTRAHGVQPGIAALTIAPQANFVGEFGDLVFSCSGTSFSGSNSYSFSRCKLDRMSFERNTSGQVVRLQILDRRWMWEFPTISGTYNMRHENGELVTDLSTTTALETANLIWQTEKTPQELAEFCLDAMGESDYDVGDLPNDSRPLVEWDVENAARALEDLCESLGCRVVLKLDDTVKICKVGSGEDLPDNLDIQVRSPGFDLPEQPDTLRIVCNRTRFQADLILEAVGLDTDGKVKLLKDLSYAPKTSGVADWSKADIPDFLAITDKKARTLAKETVWRWYRVQLPFTLFAYFNDANSNNDPVQQQITVDSLLHFIPLETEQIDTFVEDGVKKNKPAWIWGVWADASLGYVNGVTTLKTIDPNLLVGELQVDTPPAGSAADYAKKALYTRGFSIDRDRAVVKFSEIVVRWNSVTSGGNQGYGPADAVLVMRTAIGLRNPNTRAWLRYNKRRDFGETFGTKPRDIKRDDVILNVATRYDLTASFDPSAGAAVTYSSILGASNNKPDVDQACEYYLDAAENDYQGTSPEVRTYTGFQQVELDGAIQQVTFNLSTSGATTRIARNTEILINHMSYNERRFYARMRQLKEKATTSQQQGNRDARRRSPL